MHAKIGCIVTKIVSYLAANVAVYMILISSCRVYSLVCMSRGCDETIGQVLNSETADLLGLGFLQSPPQNVTIAVVSAVDLTPQFPFQRCPRLVGIGTFCCLFRTCCSRPLQAWQIRVLFQIITQILAYCTKQGSEMGCRSEMVAFITSKQHMVYFSGA